MSVTSWQTDQIVWWKGQAIDRQSEEYQRIIRRAYQAMFEQSERFRAALMQTRGIKLVHTSGEPSSYKTILTPAEFCDILMNRLYESCCQTLMSLLPTYPLTLPRLCPSCEGCV